MVTPGAILCLCALPAPAQPLACTAGDRELAVGFYAYFQPVSYSAAADPEAPEFDTHLGYEADLLTALEAIDGAGLSFSRSAIAAWDGIWLRSAGTRYDIVGGGITILDARTRDAAGMQAVVFTSGHITFRQSLLVRAEDAERLAGHGDLTSAVRVGVLRGSTGEFRLLELTGLVDGSGVLAAGTRVESRKGEVVADGSANYRITAAGASSILADRTRLHPPPASTTMPQVSYLGDLAETELLAALRSGHIDAVARGEIGNREASAASAGAFAVAALDPEYELGGFTLAARDAALASCIDHHIDWLTDGRRVGFADWQEDPAIFLRRAEAWNDR